MYCITVGTLPLRELRTCIIESIQAVVRLRLSSRYIASHYYGRILY
jgi:hypothetical protein